MGNFFSRIQMLKYIVQYLKISKLEKLYDQQDLIHFIVYCRAQETKTTIHKYPSLQNAKQPPDIRSGNTKGATLISYNRLNKISLSCLQQQTLIDPMQSIAIQEAHAILITPHLDLASLTTDE